MSTARDVRIIFAGLGPNIVIDGETPAVAWATVFEGAAGRKVADVNFHLADGVDPGQRCVEQDSIRSTGIVTTMESVRERIKAYLNDGADLPLKYNAVSLLQEPGAPTAIALFATATAAAATAMLALCSKNKVEAPKDKKITRVRNGDSDRVNKAVFKNLVFLRGTGNELYFYGMELGCIGLAMTEALCQSPAECKIFHAMVMAAVGEVLVDMPDMTYDKMKSEWATRIGTLNSRLRSAANHMALVAAHDKELCKLKEQYGDEIPQSELDGLIGPLNPPPGMSPKPRELSATDRVYLLRYIEGPHKTFIDKGEVPPTIKEELAQPSAAAASGVVPSAAGKATTSLISAGSKGFTPRPNNIKPAATPPSGAASHVAKSMPYEPSLEAMRSRQASGLPQQSSRGPAAADGAGPLTAAVSAQQPSSQLPQAYEGLTREELIAHLTQRNLPSVGGIVLPNTTSAGAQPVDAARVTNLALELCRQHGAAAGGSRQQAASGAKGGKVGSRKRKQQQGAEEQEAEQQPKQKATKTITASGRAVNAVCRE